MGQATCQLGTTHEQRRAFSGWKTALVVLIAFGLGATACSSPAGDASSGADDTSSGSAPAESASAESTSSDVASGADAEGDSESSDTEREDPGTGTDGVRDSAVPYGGPADLEPVTVAVMYPDLAVAVQFGFAEEFGDFDPVFEAFVADANKRGGIAGHPIEYAPVEFDLLLAGDSSRACLTATQDIEAFVVIALGGVYGDPVVCVVEQNETLLLALDGFPNEYYERADGRLFTFTPSKAETQIVIADSFKDLLKEAPFAVFSELDNGGDRATTEAYLLPRLDALGLSPALDIVLDSDGEVAASQIPILVEQVRSKGIKTIISSSGFFATAQFARALQSVEIDVTWIGSDAAGFAGNLYATQMDPDQLDGARAITSHTLGWQAAGLQESDRDAACRVRGETLLGTEIPVDSVDLAGVFYACNFFDVLVTAGEYIDGELTQKSLQAGIEALSEFDLADYGPAGFSPTDHTAANAIREVTWSKDCGCWSVVGEYQALPSE